MRVPFTAALVLAFASGCSGGTGSSGITNSIVPQSTQHRTTDRVAVNASGANVVANPGFETGTLASWRSCGNVNDPVITTVKAHSGTYAALIGTFRSPEINGVAALCQTVTVPASATLSFWVYEGTNDSIRYADQEADILDTNGSQLAQIYKEAKSTNGWVQKTYDMSSFAGQTVQLEFAVTGNGYSSDYIYEDLDDVSLTGTGSTAAPSPTPTAVPTATPTPGGTPTPRPSATPTSPAPTATPVPTATPSGTPFTCNNQQFLTYQSEFGNGQISGDQFVDVCGSVTQVLPERHTQSGNHGYFYVQMPSGYNIEIVSNLDAMAQASTDRPPSTWPWVSVGQYVYVQGRYYYDNSSSQGIDWTEDDTSQSWPHLGYVAVCDSSGSNCSKYW